MRHVADCHHRQPLRFFTNFTPHRWQLAFAIAPTSKNVVISFLYPQRGHLTAWLSGITIS
jgi:hypothetical protein